MKRMNSNLLTSLKIKKDLEMEAWARKQFSDLGYKKVAVVDDSPSTLALVRSALNSLENVHVISFKDEFDALRGIVQEKPDLILLDIQLETLDGHHVASLLKELTVTSQVIFMSTNTDELQKTEMGIAKPFTQKELKNYLEFFLSTPDGKFAA